MANLFRSPSLNQTRLKPVKPKRVTPNESPLQGLGIMALAFFGKGIGALGWAVVSDTSPKEIAGLSGGLFNTFGNIASITTPIVIGYIIQNTGSFNGALVYVAANALVAVLSYLVIVGEIKRVVLTNPQSA